METTNQPADEHKWMGVPFSKLTPVQRSNALFFFGGDPRCITYGVNATGLSKPQRRAALDALRASGPFANEEEVERELHVTLARELWSAGDAIL